jgi:hypothetical protein
MLENFTNQTFETTKKPIMVEVMTYSGSAFAATIDGEQVFINQRIVQSLNLQEGMTLLAHLLPNYVDKRDTIPWRAMRVEPLDRTEVQGPSAAEPEPAPVAPDPGERIFDLIENDPHAYFTTVDLAEELGMDTKTVNNWCMGLHNKGLIARADVYAGPGQKRASFVLWALNSKSFAS